MKRVPLERNVALDYLRVLALCLMLCAHNWTYLQENTFGHYSNGTTWINVQTTGVNILDGQWHHLLYFIFNLAPAFFFIAFGMTQRLLVVKPAKSVLYTTVFFGYIAVLHSIFLMPTLMEWNFLLLLWMASVLVYVFAMARMNKTAYFTLFFLIILANYVVPLESVMNRTWPLQGEFYPLPWLAFVFVGFAFGIEGPSRKKEYFTLAVCASGIAFVIFTMYFQDKINYLFPYINLGMKKDHDQTSNYIVLSSSAVFISYILFDMIERLLIKLIWFDRWVKFLSKYLIVATVLHYLIRRSFMLQFNFWAGHGYLGIGSLKILAMAVAIPLYIMTLTIITALAALVWKQLSIYLKLEANPTFAATSAILILAIMVLKLDNNRYVNFANLTAYFLAILFSLQLKYLKSNLKTPHLVKDAIPVYDDSPPGIP